MKPCKDWQREMWFPAQSTMESSYTQGNEGMDEALRSARPNRRHPEQSNFSPDITGISTVVVDMLHSARGSHMAALLRMPHKDASSTYQNTFCVAKPFQSEQLDPETMYNARKSEMIEGARMQARFGHIMRSNRVQKPK